MIAISEDSVASVASAAPAAVGRAKSEIANKGISAFWRNLYKFIYDVLFIFIFNQEMQCELYPKMEMDDSGRS
ncbi:hypothetical protein D3C78_605520 [compost metagenome]